MLILNQKATLQVWTKTVSILHLRCLLITFLSWHHLGTTVVLGWKQPKWLGKGQSINSQNDKRRCFMISGVPLPPKITFFLSVRGNLLYLMLNDKQGIITKNTSQSTHFIKSESTYHGPVIYFLSCRSTNVTQLFCCYLLNWAHNVWKSHGTTVTPPGSSGFMLNSEDRHF